ncbi:hypothetical protein, partial [Neglectibacter timonensis]|uniref:hypothetical protein n=1 Tax=Neglectibacter timonensis TaxID=1776382 RepID=UPI00399666E9
LEPVLSGAEEPLGALASSLGAEELSGLFDSSAGVGSGALDCCGAEEAEAARFVPLLHAAKVSSSASAVKTAAILFIITLSPFYFE